MSLNDSYNPEPMPPLSTVPPWAQMIDQSVLKYSVLGDDMGRVPRPEQALLLENSLISGHIAFDFQNPQQLIAARSLAGLIPVVTDYNSRMDTASSVLAQLGAEPMQYQGI